MTAPHHCHAQGCTANVPPKMFMCRVHWFMVPKGLRDQVWAHYVPGQEIRKDPTPEYLEITRAAIEAVAKRDLYPRTGRPPHSRENR